MAVGYDTLISLCAEVTLALVGAALVLLILWQGPRERSNQYFALCMVIFSAYGFANLPLSVAYHAGIDPATPLRIVGMLYVAGAVLVFNFVLVFAGLPRRVR
ncbi:MAG: hypothetical protein K8S97_12975, partial [Anaerolineae bacterium]|nr:hypothetical protein [Anaerolineae bacterium]